MILDQNPTVKSWIFIPDYFTTLQLIMNLNFDHSAEELFEYYSEEDISFYLWEMYQCWLLELSQMGKTHLEVNNRQYFFQLLAAQVSKQLKQFQEKVPPSSE